MHNFSQSRDALKHLQQYGTGSQSSTDTPPIHSVEVNDGNNISAQVPRKINKSVSFVYQGKDNLDRKTSSSETKTPRHRTKKLVQCNPSGRRPITRSMSPLKSPDATDVVTSISSSPSRLTRFATAAIKASQNNENMIENSAATAEGWHVLESAILDKSMNKKLELDFGSVEGPAESK